MEERTCLTICTNWRNSTRCVWVQRYCELLGLAECSQTFNKRLFVRPQLFSLSNGFRLWRAWFIVSDNTGSSAFRKSSFQKWKNVTNLKNSMPQTKFFKSYSKDTKSKTESFQQACLDRSDSHWSWWMQLLFLDNCNILFSFLFSMTLSFNSLPVLPFETHVNCLSHLKKHSSLCTAACLFMARCWLWHIKRLLEEEWQVAAHFPPWQRVKGGQAQRNYECPHWITV